MTTDTELSELAQAIIDSYLPVENLGQDYLHLAIAEYAEFLRLGEPYTYNDKVISPAEFIAVIDEILTYRKEMN